MLSGVSASGSDTKVYNDDSVSEQFARSLSNTANFESQNFSFHSHIVSPVLHKVNVYKARYDVKQAYREFDIYGFDRGIQVSSGDINQLPRLNRRASSGMKILEANNSIRPKDTDRSAAINLNYNLYEGKNYFVPVKEWKEVTFKGATR